MALVRTSKKTSANRYSGVDTMPWVIKDTLGKRVGGASYASFTEANTEARRYIEATGNFAQAVRA